MTNEVANKYDAVHVSTVHQWNDPRVLAKECRSLSDAGYKVGLIITAPETHQMYGVDLIGLKRRRNRWLRMTLGVLEAGRHVFRSGAHIVHFHDPELIPLGLVARLFGYQVIFDVHEDYVTSIKTVSKTIPQGLRGGFSTGYRLTIPLQKKAFHIIIAERYYSETYPEATPVLNYPDLRLFSRFRSLERSAPEAIKLLYTGNVTLARGARNHAALVEALPDAQLTMIGRCQGDLIGDLQAQPGVSLANDGAFAPFEDIVEAYSNAWTAALAVFPYSDHYTRKALTKIYEYAAAGIPVICSDFPVWKELVGDNDLGLCVPPNDLEAQKAAVVRLAADKALYDRISQSARRFAHEAASWDSEARRLTALYDDLHDQADRIEARGSPL